MAAWTLTMREAAPGRRVRLHYIVRDEARYTVTVREEAATAWAVDVIGEALRQAHERLRERRS